MVARFKCSGTFGMDDWTMTLTMVLRAQLFDLAYVALG